MLQNKIFVIALLAIAGIARAGQYDDTTFNAGGEISIINMVSYNNGSSSDLNKFKTSDSAGKLAIKKNEPGVNIFVGARFNQYVGAEIGFGLIQNASANVQNGGVASNKINNYYIDLLGFLNIASQVDLVGDVGVGWLQSKANVTNTTFVNLNDLTKTKLGIRAGGGLQYYFAPSWATRAMIRYQDGNPNFLKSNVSFSLGILYTF